jgi:hypothetical protein
MVFFIGGPQRELQVGWWQAGSGAFSMIGGGIGACWPPLDHIDHAAVAALPSPSHASRGVYCG